MKNKGFTLVELLVSIGLVLIIGTVGTSMIASILRSYNKAHIINEIEQNGNYVLSLMESQIRNAASATLTGTCNGAGNRCLSLEVTPQEGSLFTYSIGDDGNGTGMGAVMKDGAVLTNNHSVSGVNVLHSGDPGTTSHFYADGLTVQIVLKIQQATGAPGRVDYQAETTLQTTVVVRGGYE